MSGSPVLKIYTADGEYVASAKHAHVAAGAALHAGEGSTVRLEHAKRDTLVTITENHWESYDALTNEIIDRLSAVRRQYLDKITGQGKCSTAGTVKGGWYYAHGSLSGADKPIRKLMDGALDLDNTKRLDSIDVRAAVEHLQRETAEGWKQLNRVAS